MRSLKSTLILGTTTGTVAVVLVTGVAIYLLVKADLVQQFDRTVHETARLLASSVTQSAAKIKLEFDELDMWEFERSDEPAYLQLWLDDGTTAYRSPSLGQADLTPFGGPLQSPEYRRVNLPNGQVGRAIGMTFVPRVEDEEEEDREDQGEHEDENGNEHNRLASRDSGGRMVTLVLARNTATITGTLLHLAAVLAILGTVSIGVLGSVLWTVIRRGLHPINQLASQISTLGEHDLSARIAISDAPCEVQPVIGRLNSLLAQLEGDFQREREFSANVAHELRTPLAGLSMKMDVTLSRHREPSEYQNTIAECRKVVLDMTSMVENLLSLARLEAGQVEIQLCPLSLNDLVRRCWKPFQEPARSRGLRVEWDLPVDVPIVSDPAQLQLAIRNLFQNAVHYTNDGGSLRIETKLAGQRAELSIRNSGSTVSADQVRHVFERFWRGDAARSEVGAHCGLGLALAQKSVAILHGEIRAQSAVDGDFQIVISIPNEHPSVARPKPDNVERKWKKV